MTLFNQIIMKQAVTTKFKLMESVQYYKEPLIDILADRISSDFKMQKDNARWRVIHSTKLAKDFFKYDFTVNSIIFLIGQKKTATNVSILMIFNTCSRQKGD